MKALRVQGGEAELERMSWRVGMRGQYGPKGWSSLGAKLIGRDAEGSSTALAEGISADMASSSSASHSLKTVEGGGDRSGEGVDK